MGRGLFPQGRDDGNVALGTEKYYTNFLIISNVKYKQKTRQKYLGAKSLNIPRNKQRINQIIIILHATSLNKDNI